MKKNKTPGLRNPGRTSSILNTYLGEIEGDANLTHLMRPMTRSLALGGCGLDARAVDIRGGAGFRSCGRDGKEIPLRHPWHLRRPIGKQIKKISGKVRNVAIETEVGLGNGFEPGARMDSKFEDGDNLGPRTPRCLGR